MSHLEARKKKFITHISAEALPLSMFVQEQEIIQTENYKTGLK